MQHRAVVVGRSWACHGWPPLYRKLNYSDEAIRAFGLDPDLPVGAPALGAAAVGATPRRNPLCWWNIQTSHALPSPLRLWTLWWAKIPRRRSVAKRSASFGPRLSVGWFWARSHHGRSLAKRGVWPPVVTCASIAKASGSRAVVQLAWSKSLDETRARRWACSSSWMSLRRHYTTNGSKTGSSTTRGWSPWRTVGLGPTCCTPPSFPFQWSRSSGTDDLGVHPEQPGAFQPAVYREGCWQACKESQKLWGGNHCLRGFFCEPRLPIALTGIKLLSFIPIFGWMCEGFRLPVALWSLFTMMGTTTGIVWHWSFMIFPPGIYPLLAFHVTSAGPLSVFAFWVLRGLLLFLDVQFDFLHLPAFCISGMDLRMEVVCSGATVSRVAVWSHVLELCGMGWLGLAFGYLALSLKGFTMTLLSQFKFPSPFTRAYLNSTQLAQEALGYLNIGPFQSDGEFLCMCFLKPSENPPNAEGLGSRPWEAFRRVLEDLGEHSDQWFLQINGDNGSWGWMRESYSLHRVDCSWLGTKSGGLSWKR